MGEERDAGVDSGAFLWWAFEVEELDSHVVVERGALGL